MKKVHIYYRKDDLGQIQVFKRCRNEFKKYGYDLNIIESKKAELDQEADFYIIQQHHIDWDKLDQSDALIVVSERYDSSSILCRKAAKHPSTHAISKIAVLDKELMNETEYKYHLSLTGLKLGKPKTLLEEEEKNKIKAGINFGQYEQLNSYIKHFDANKIKNNKRTHEVNFMGLTQHNHDTVAMHRKKAVKELQKTNFKKIVKSSRAFSREQYKQIMFNTKVVISPWGHGEVCYRDYEAMLAGCIIIKPYSDFVHTHPELFKDGETYISCKPDFSDLKKSIRKALDCWQDWQDQRIEQAKKLRENYQPKNIVEHHINNIFPT